MNETQKYPKTARDVLQMAVEHAQLERMADGYIPPGGVQYVTIPAWVAEDLLTNYAPAFPAVDPVEREDKTEDVAALVTELTEWAAQTFPHATNASRIAHLRSEAEELAACPDDVEEMADVFMLLAQCAPWPELVAAVRAKLEKNKARKWGERNAEGFVEHVRDAVSPSSDTGTGVPELPKAVADTIANLRHVKQQHGELCLTSDGIFWLTLADHIAALEREMEHRRSVYIEFERQIAEVTEERDELQAKLTAAEADANRAVKLLSEQDALLTEQHALLQGAEADTTRLDWLSHHMAQQRSGDWKAIGLDPIELTLRDAIDARSGEASHE